MIGTGLGVPVRGLTEDEAQTHFDWFARFVAIDNPASSALTRNALGWRPQESGAPDRHEGKRIFFVIHERPSHAWFPSRGPHVPR